MDRFTSFEGNTGPYILYTIVRIKSILNKYQAEGKEAAGLTMTAAKSDSEKALMLEVAKYDKEEELYCASEPYKRSAGRVH